MFGRSVSVRGVKNGIDFRVCIMIRLYILFITLHDGSVHLFLYFLIGDLGVVL